MGTEAVVGHKDLVLCQSSLPASLPLVFRTLPLIGGVGGEAGDIDKSQIRMGRGAEQIQVPVQEAGAAATVGGSSKPTAE